MIASGLRAKITCVDPKTCYPQNSPAATSTAQFLADLPPASIRAAKTASSTHSSTTVPGFRRPIDVLVGEVIERDNFIFADISLHDSLNRLAHA